MTNEQITLEEAKHITVTNILIKLLLVIIATGLIGCNKDNTVDNLVQTTESTKLTSGLNLSDIIGQTTTSAELESTASIEESDLPTSYQTNLLTEINELLHKEFTQEVTTDAITNRNTSKLATDTLQKFKKNIETGQMQKITNETTLQINTRTCTVISEQDNGSIVEFNRIKTNEEITFESSTNTLLPITYESILITYMSDPTAWQVICDNDIIYALMPTEAIKATEYERQLVQTIIQQNANGLDIKIELVYPYTSSYDQTNNCAVYFIKTDGNFKFGSNADQYLIYKEDIQ